MTKIAVKLFRHLLLRNNGVRNLFWFGTKSHPFYLLSITVSHIPETIAFKSASHVGHCQMTRRSTPTDSNSLSKTNLRKSVQSAVKQNPLHLFPSSRPLASIRGSTVLFPLYFVILLFPFSLPLLPPRLPDPNQSKPNALLQNPRNYQKSLTHSATSA